ncbi:GDSL-type esterase/lipase family protein [Porphyromonas miyakawae]|uniref:GDSL-type esterase/lipase family protein n=1 Tax=Porphyromonas miyakawae TaxID=3137470 RepID=A0ABQ0DZS8_9PORP
MKKRLLWELCLLLPFYVNMAHGQEIIHIVHIGDSHLQSGYMSAAIRKELAKERPLAGLGLITPYRLAGTNAPEYYQITSNVRWRACKISYNKCCDNTPPGGICIACQGGKYTFHIRSKSTPFDQIVVFRGNETPPLTTKGATLRLGEEVVSGFVSDTILLPRLVSSISLHPNKPTSQKALYGNFLLTNNLILKGFLYSPIALNGAMYATYDQPDFINAFSRLNPDLVVISLGTNEILAKRFRKDTFKSEVDHFIRSIKSKLSPQSRILLVSPPPTLLKNGQVNPNTRLVREALAEEARELRIDYFDLYQAMEQDQKATERYKAGNFFAFDRIHFSIHGYQVMGAYVGHAIAALLNQ